MMPYFAILRCKNLLKDWIGIQDYFASLLAIFNNHNYPVGWSKEVYKNKLLSSYENIYDFEDEGHKVKSKLYRILIKVDNGIRRTNTYLFELTDDMKKKV